MMKKYNKPEIVTLALDMVDVIETSGGGFAANQLMTDNPSASIAAVEIIETQITQMNETWHW